MEAVTDFLFLGSKITVDHDCSQEIKRIKDTCSLEDTTTNLESILKSRYHFAYKCLFSQSYGFSSSHIQMWELDHKYDWSWERLRAGKKGATEDEMVGWHHWLNGHEFEQTPGYSEGQWRLACCSPWSLKESDMT